MLLLLGVCLSSRSTSALLQVCFCLVFELLGLVAAGSYKATGIKFALFSIACPLN